jgi:hypothetical protein
MGMRGSEMSCLRISLGHSLCAFVKASCLYALPINPCILRYKNDIEYSPSSKKFNSVSVDPLSDEVQKKQQVVQVESRRNLTRMIHL